MSKLKLLCPILVTLTLAGCAASPLPLPQPIPALDSSLASDCAKLIAPTALNFDAWQEWIQGTVLKAYGECAAKHHATVQAWPSTQSQPQPKADWWHRTFG